MQERFRSFTIRTFMALGLSLSSLFAWSQFAITPTTSNCGCDGSAIFTLPTGTVANYEVRDRNASLFASGSTVTGQISLTGLCASFYSITILQGTVSTVYPFNVPSPTMNIGTAITDSLCYNGGVQDLNLLLPGITPGGTWYDVNGIALNPQEFDPLSSPEGLYTYGIQAGFCEVTTGLNLQIIQNPGIFTFYLICESTAPFHLLDVMYGYPESGGTWTTLTGTPTTDMFDPATFGNSSYRYTLSTHSQCAPTTSILVVQPDPEPYAGEDTTLLTCADGVPFNLFSQLPGNPQPGGTWANNANGQPISATFDPTVMGPGVYRYRVQGSGPCGSDFAYVTINYVPTNPSGASSSQIICPGDPAMDMYPLLGGSPLIGGVWTNPSNQVTDNIFDPSTDIFGNYHYAYPSVGCSPLQTTLSINPAPVPSAGLDNSGTTCQNSGTFNLNNLLTPGATQSGYWTNSSGTILASSLVNTPIVATFNYTYHVAAGSCPEDVAAITLNVNAPMPSILNQTVALCSTEAPLDLNSLYPTHPTIVFQNALGQSISDILDPSQAQNSNITAVLPTTNACPSSTATINVSIDHPAFDSTTFNIGTCLDNGVFHLNTLSGLIDFSQGQWFDGSNNTISEAVPINLAGQFDYHFTSSTGGVCPESQIEVVLEVGAPIEAGSDTAFVFCHSDSPIPLTTLFPASGGISGTWSLNGSPYLPVIFDPAIDNSGDYIFSVNPNNSCPIDHATMHITVNQGFGLTAGNDILICSTSNLGQLGGQTINGISYQWSPGAGLSATNISNPTVNLINSGVVPTTTMYQLTGTDGICTIQDSVQVTVYPLPSLNTSSAVDLCLGESTILVASGADTYQWQPSGIFTDPTSAQQLISPTSSIVVQLLAYNQWNCQSTRTIDITVHPLPNIVLEADTLNGCSPMHFEASLGTGSTNIVSSKWYLDNEQLSDTSPLFTEVFVPGVYDLTVIAESEFGCTDTITAQEILEVSATPFAEFITTPSELSTVDHVATFINTSTGASIYNWDFSGIGQSTESSPTYDFPSDLSQTFQVCLEATNEFGCVDSVCHFLPLFNDYVFYAPNAFSPDNDGINDVFKPVFQGFDNATYHLLIFDRWGEKVFETKDPNQPWTGNMLGGTYYVEGGIYVWQVQIKQPDVAEIKKFRGHITLLR